MGFKNRTKNYPLYETTVFEDFRIMTENVARKYPDRVAFSFRRTPKDADVVHVTFAQARTRVKIRSTIPILASDAGTKQPI